MAYEPVFLHLAFLTKTSSVTCSVLGAVQLVPISSAQRTVEFQSGPRREMNANQLVSAAVNLQHFVSSLTHSNQGWKRLGSSKAQKILSTWHFLKLKIFLRDIIKA